jgi:hypothetical protein
MNPFRSVKTNLLVTLVVAIEMAAFILLVRLDSRSYFVAFAVSSVVLNWLLWEGLSLRARGNWDRQAFHRPSTIHRVGAMLLLTVELGLLACLLVYASPASLWDVRIPLVMTYATITSILNFYVTSAFNLGLFATVKSMTPSQESAQSEATSS